jgi:hypothetical protein
MNQPVKYKLYPTVLNNFLYYLEDDSDEGLQKLLDSINRKPFESEAANKGNAFNELVDKAIKDNEQRLSVIENGQEEIDYNGFKFKSKIVLDFADKFEGALPQVFVKAELQTSLGNVLLYGFVDETLAYKQSDIKTTGNYTFPKYNGTCQHLLYPYCAREKGIMIETFEYYITDFNNIYSEEYVYKPERDKQKLINLCERFIVFLEANKGLITDKKIFNLI